MLQLTVDAQPLWKAAQRFPWTAHWLGPECGKGKCVLVALDT